jgi:hypothetical protein
MNSTEQEQEIVITKLIADTFHFTIKGKGAVCNHCGIRFQSYSIGKPMTDRMIQHATRHGVGYDLKQQEI